LSKQVLKVLAKRGYLFDASTLPTFLGPLARAYYFMTSRLDRQQRQERKILFGSLKDGLRPIDPYLWEVEGERVLEIPVTTLPLFRIPFHISYVLYLSRISQTIARLYFQTALNLCRLTGTRPSILLHPLDLLGNDDISTLGFFPGMDLKADEKLKRVEGFLSALVFHFDVLPLGEYARDLHERGTLAAKVPTV
jgi:hypothetical protein